MPVLVDKLHIHFNVVSKGSAPQVEADTSLGSIGRAAERRAAEIQVKYDLFANKFQKAAQSTGEAFGARWGEALGLSADAVLVAEKAIDYLTVRLGVLDEIEAQHTTTGMNPRDGESGEQVRFDCDSRNVRVWQWLKEVLPEEDVELAEHSSASHVFAVFRAGDHWFVADAAADQFEPGVVKSSDVGLVVLPFAKGAVAGRAGELTFEGGYDTDWAFDEGFESQYHSMPYGNQVVKPYEKNHEPLVEKLHQGKIGRVTADLEEALRERGLSKDVAKETDGDSLRRHASGAGGAVPSWFHHLIERSKGFKIPGNMRAKMEDWLGADFDQVRLHTDASAQQAAEAVNAEAFAVGNDVFFSAGSYNLGSPAGVALLGHELTHVAQDRAGGTTIRRRLFSFGSRGKTKSGKRAGGERNENLSYDASLATPDEPQLMWSSSRKDARGQMVTIEFYDFGPAAKGGHGSRATAKVVTYGDEHVEVAPIAPGLGAKVYAFVAKYGKKKGLPFWSAKPDSLSTGSSSRWDKLVAQGKAVFHTAGPAASRYVHLKPRGGLRRKTYQVAGSDSLEREAMANEASIYELVATNSSGMSNDLSDALFKRLHGDESFNARNKRFWQDWGYKGYERGGFFGTSQAVVGAVFSGLFTEVREIGEVTAGSYFTDSAGAGADLVWERARQQLRNGKRAGTLKALWAVAPTERLKIAILAWEIISNYRYGGSEARFNSDFGTNLTPSQVADIDHFYCGAVIGFVPGVGSAAGVGLSLLYDGGSAIQRGARAQSVEAMVYDLEQVQTDLKGVAFGATLLFQRGQDPIAPVGGMAELLHSGRLSKKDLQDPGAGLPLEESVRTRLERTLGEDLFDVRVHTGLQAEHLAKAFDAEAFAVGQHIFLGRGAGDPDTPEGIGTLAHEATHVVQARKGRLDDGVSTREEAELEAEAHAVEHIAVAQAKAESLIPTPPEPLVYRADPAPAKKPAAAPLEATERTPAYRDQFHTADPIMRAMHESGLLERPFTGDGEGINQTQFLDLLRDRIMELMHDELEYDNERRETLSWNNHLPMS